MNFKGLLRCEGKKIVDANGNNFILQGLGLGGWLVKEGYMLHTAATSPSTIDEAIIDLIGKKAGQQFLKTYEENYCTEKDIEVLAKLGFNSVRLPFHYKMLSKRRGVYLEEGFKFMDEIISWCKKYDLYIILDMHCAPGSQNGQNISDDLSDESKLYTQKEKYHGWCEEIWQTIAKRYVNEDYIAGYDLINEPVLNHGLTYDDLRQSFLKLTEAVRKVDTRHIIFIEGAHYSTNFEGLSPKWDDNMVYAFHKYWNPPSDDSLRRYLELREATDAPIWLGESGENSNQWFYENIDLVEKHNIGWNWWTHKKVKQNTNIYNVVPPDGYEELIEFWHKRGPRPSKKKALKTLTAFLEAIKLENCEYHEDVYYATLKRNETKPFKKHLVSANTPATIALHEYDIGRNGQTYERINAMRVEPRRPTGNRGRELRNDGIDIFKDKKGYYTGLNEDDQWTLYTFEVLDEKVYQFAIEILGIGVIEVRIDDKVYPIKVNNPRYRLLKFADLKLGIGIHKLIIKVKQYGTFGRVVRID